MICPAFKPAVLASIVAFSTLPALAETVEATRTMRSGTIIMPSDVRVSPDMPQRNEIRDLGDAIGMEVRGSIREGRKIRRSDLRAPILVKRNELVDIVYRSGTLVIRGEGRALRDGGKGQAIRVMNLDSRNIVTGRVGAQGLVEVSR